MNRSRLTRLRGERRVDHNHVTAWLIGIPNADQPHTAITRLACVLVNFGPQSARLRFIQRIGPIRVVGDDPQDTLGSGDIANHRDLGVGVLRQAQDERRCDEKG